MNNYTRHHESWTDYINYATTPAKMHNEHTKPSCDWNGNITFDEACDLARTGWTEAAGDADQLARGITRQVIANRTESTWTFPQDVTGESLDVATFLTGTPECFISPMSVSTARPARVVRIVVGTGMLAHVDEAVYRRRGSAIVALIDCIMEAGYTVELWGWHAATAGHGTKKRISHAYRIQGSDQPVNIGKIMFALAHPAAHRRINFSARCNPEVPDEVLAPFGNMGATIQGDPSPGDLPPAIDEQTLFVPAIEPGQRWTFDESVEWITERLERL